MVLFREVRMIPSLYQSLSILDELNCLELGVLHEVFDLILVHRVMLIVRQERRAFPLQLFLSLRILPLLEEIFNQLIIYPHHVLLYPSVVESLLLHIGDVVLHRTL